MASTSFVAPTARVAQVAWDASTNTLTDEAGLPGWVHNTKLVAKPDQLIKRRGKAGLLKLNADWSDAKAWIAERAGKPQKVEAVTGTLNNFIVEPFCPHDADQEFYVCINSAREGDYVLFTHEGGVDAATSTPRPRSCSSLRIQTSRSRRATSGPRCSSPR